MSNPPVITEPFYEFDVEFLDLTTAQVYMIYVQGDVEGGVDAADASGLAAVIYNAIKANSNVNGVTQNLWGEDVQGSFTASVVTPPESIITYNPNH